MIEDGLKWIFSWATWEIFKLPSEFLKSIPSATPSTVLQDSSGVFCPGFSVSKSGETKPSHRDWLKQWRNSSTSKVKPQSEEAAKKDIRSLHSFATRNKEEEWALLRGRDSALGQQRESKYFLFTHSPSNKPSIGLFSRFSLRWPPRGTSVFSPITAPALWLSHPDGNFIPLLFLLQWIFPRTFATVIISCFLFFHPLSALFFNPTRK